MQQADGVVFVIIGAEGVGADQLGHTIGLVGIGLPLRAHFMEDHRHAKLCRLPCGFRTGKTAADNVNGLQCHNLQPSERIWIGPVI